MLFEIRDISVFKPSPLPPNPELNINSDIVKKPGNGGGCAGGLEGLGVTLKFETFKRRKGRWISKYAAYTSTEFARYLIESVLPYING